MNSLWLIGNIPFNNSNDNVVGFEDATSQQNYFKGLSTSVIQINNIRITDSQTSFRLDVEYNDSINIDYMMLLQGGKYYYMFVDSVAYVDERTTMFNVSLDIWQTYMFDYEIKDAFISREHQDRFRKADGFNVVPIYNLLEENIELGTNYEVIDKTYKVDNNHNSSIDGHIIWYYIVSSDKLMNVGTTQKIIRGNDYVVSLGYYLYAIPIFVKKTTIPIITLPFTERSCYYNDGGEQVLLGGKELLSTLASEPAVVSMYVSRYSMIDYTYVEHNQGNTVLITNDNKQRVGVILGGLLDFGDVNYFDKEFDFSDMVNISTNVNQLKTKSYKNEPKLFTKPYTSYNFTNMLSEPLELGLNEFNKIYYQESFGLNYKSILYSKKFDSTKMFDSLISTKNNELPLRTDKYVNYIMNNKASATTGVALSGVLAFAGTTALMLGTGGTAGIIAGGLVLSQGQKIVNEMVKQSDLKNSPKSIRELGNDIAFNLGLDNNGMYVNCIVRRPLENYFNRAFEYLHRMGYSSNNFGVPDIKSRETFNYIKCVTVNVGGNINQNIKVKLEDMFINGFRIWHNRGSNFKMYDYDSANIEVRLK